MRLWKRKWFVLADFCLFYYKGENVMLTGPSAHFTLSTFTTVHVESMVQTTNMHIFDLFILLLVLSDP